MERSNRNFTATKKRICEEEEKEGQEDEHR
jgi:hypothetical protein